MLFRRRSKCTINLNTNTTTTTTTTSFANVPHGGSIGAAGVQADAGGVVLAVRTRLVVVGVLSRALSLSLGCTTKPHHAVFRLTRTPPASAAARKRSQSDHASARRARRARTQPLARPAAVERWRYGAAVCSPTPAGPAPAGPRARRCNGFAAAEPLASSILQVCNVAVAQPVAVDRPSGVEQAQVPQLKCSRCKLTLHCGRTCQKRHYGRRALRRESGRRVARSAKTAGQSRR